MHAIARAPSVRGSFEPRKGIMLRALASNLDSLENPEPGGILLIGTNTKDYGSSQKQLVQAFVVNCRSVDVFQDN